MNRKPRLILVSGPGASGKTFISKHLARACSKAVYLDKDSLASVFVEALLHLSGDPHDQRDSEVYFTKIRPLEYKALLSVASDNLRLGSDVIADAPFIREVMDNDWMSQLPDVIGHPANVWTLWVDSDVATIRARMEKRNAPRDQLKLRNWAEWEQQLKKLTKPPPAERTIWVDNALVPYKPLDAQLAEVINLIDQS